MKVINYKKVNLSKIVYLEPVKTAGGCLISRTQYAFQKEKIPIFIQSPRLRVSSDLEILDSKTYLELELDKKHINFYEFINNIDDQNISKTYTHSEEWFQEKLPMDVVDDFYKTNIKMRKYNKSPIIKFKIPIYKNKTRKSCDIFGDDLKPLDMSEIKKNTEVICILELEGIKFFKQRFETEWKVIQVRVYPEVVESNPCLINEEFLSDNEDTHRDPFPEDAISLNSSMELQPNEEASNTLDTDETNTDSMGTVKSIEINMSESKPKSDSLVKVEKVSENISIDITPSSNEDVETLETNLTNVDSTSVASQESKSIICHTNTMSGTNNLDENLDENLNENNNETVNDISNANSSEENDNLMDTDNEKTDSDPDSDLETDNELDSDNDILDNYYSDNFTDEEEICDGLESNLEEINFIETEELDLTNQEPIEETSTTDLNENMAHTENNIPEDKEESEYQNKSIQELIDEINKFKQLATDRENEMSELKSKYRNLFSELKL